MMMMVKKLKNIVDMICLGRVIARYTIVDNETHILKSGSSEDHTHTHEKMVLSMSGRDQNCRKRADLVQYGGASILKENTMGGARAKNHLS